ncbi:aminopeptidase N [Cephus cinctus]|uniref:Aminopeptidase n=1 Tax=Cephus cinctus TaxID=211228 RepID=A0AAJ7FTI2_CEPCN|nr:aminopeptidase N [Cephus cinctus]XP_015607567.1 aminopeptidase N [Cephus cinctus]
MKILLTTTLLLAAVITASLTNGSEEIVDDATTTNYRLPNNSVPISYFISLIPYLVVDNFTFDGVSMVELEVLEPSSLITLHILNLTIDESATSLVSSGNINYKIASHTYDTTKQFLILNFATVLPTGYYTLFLKYVGILDNEILNGFYRSSYTNDDGETVWLATTLFKATGARRAFPCWDEPALKATFTISIKHDVNYTALSNMPVASQSEIDETDNKLWTTFETTPIMSTYLVAFVVSDYGYVSNDEKTFRIWTRKNILNSTAYALTVGKSELAYLERYTSIPFALPKIDEISIPDIAFDGVENLGIFTYSEKELQYVDGVSTTSAKQEAATITSHEFAHQWFGNLITSTWWKYVWLNEGFATYFEYYITDKVEDNWRLMEQFIVRIVQLRAFIADSSETTRPLNQDVSTPEEIFSLFDSITYDKAASVIHMMSNFLTPQVFRDGLIRYLKNNAYKAVTPDDLWSASQEVSDESEILPPEICLKKVMDTWVEQPGFPLITVTRDYSTGTADISQERYFQSGASDDGTRWWVPISYTTQSDLDFSSTSPREWIPQGEDNIVLSGFESTDWTIFNIQQSGYYRVNYDETNWKLIANYLDSDDYIKIHPINRAQIIDDTYNLALANRISFSIFLDISVYIRRDIDYISWYPMLTAENYLYQKLANTRSFSLFKRFCVERLEKSVLTLGYDQHNDDEHLIKLHRSNMLMYACFLDSEECRSNATAKLVAYLEDPIANPISPDLRDWAFSSGLNNANAPVWNMVLDLYAKTPSLAMLSHLGFSEDEEILTNYMKLATTDNSTILKEHASDAFASIYYGSANNINFAFNYLIDNFDKLYAFWDQPTDEMIRHVSAFGNLLTTREQLTKLKALVEKHSDVFGSDGQTAIANVESNVKWTDTYEPVFYEWFTNFYKL